MFNSDIWKLLENKKSCTCVIGYACINDTLGNSKPKSKAIMVNRGMVKKTFLERGLPYAGELALQNIYDLEKIVEWNYRHNIFLYRMSSDMFPWSSEYSIDDLPQATLIKEQLVKVGALAKKYNQRLTFHPGQFNVLLSPHENIVKNTIKELSFHAAVMDIMDLPRSAYAKINIHLGGAYGDKVAAMERFCTNFQRLPESVKTRLTVENDDKKSMYTVEDLYDGIHKKLGIPIVFDSLHHQCHPGGLSEQDAFLLAINTWPKGIEPIIHVSQSKKTEDCKAPAHAHADYVTNFFDVCGKKVSIMLEAKAKEKAVQRYKQGCCA